MYIQKRRDVLYYLKKYKKYCLIYFPFLLTNLRKKSIIYNNNSYYHILWRYDNESKRLSYRTKLAGRF